jgi:hypothetical protein
MNYTDFKKRLKQIPMRVYILTLVLFVTIFLLLLDTSRMYKSTVSILLIPKSEIANTQIEEITSSAVEFPKMLSFFDRMLKDNSEIKDFTLGHTPDERKQLWNKYLKVSPKSTEVKNIVDISLYAKKQADSEILSRKTAQTLFSVMSGYYNVKTDLEMRIVDGPISSTIVLGMTWIILFSLIAALVLAFFIHIITEKFSLLAFNINGSQIKNVLQKISDPLLASRQQNINSIQDLYLPEELEAMKNDNINQQSNINELPKEALPEKEKEILPNQVAASLKMQYPNFPEMPVHQAPKAVSAPDNLPIFEDSSLQFGAPTEANIQEIKNEQPLIQPEKRSEPTQEEIKKRLNALLGG